MLWSTQPYVNMVGRRRIGDQSGAEEHKSHENDQETHLPRQNLVYAL